MSLMTTIQSARRFGIKRKETHQIRPARPRTQRRDCQGQLLAALEAMAGPDSTIDDANMSPWCSATFVGAQHRIVLRLSCADAAQHAVDLAARLRDAEFTLHGHIVADVSVDEVRDVEGAALLRLGVLTIEDW